jgi:hypothetical protein
MPDRIKVDTYLHNSPSSEINTGTFILQGKKSAEHVTVTCPPARSTGVAHARALLEAGQGELLKTPSPGFVGAFLSAPAEFVEPEAPSGALGPVAGFSALEVSVDVEGFRDRFERSTRLKPTTPGSTGEPNRDKPPEVSLDLANSESSHLSDVASGLPVSPGQLPVDVPCSSS